MTSSANLNGEELERYARHIVLRDIGGPGQQRLKAAKVLVIGAGGLGSPVIAYLAAAGVGVIGIVDDDIVSLSNLQRQILHDTPSLGVAKTESAARQVKRLNPNVKVVQHHFRLDETNAADMVADYDIVADGSDNFATRYCIADACAAAGKPLVTAAVGQFDASLTMLKPYESDASGNPNPRYRDIFPDEPPQGMVPTCAEAGILGALTGVIGSLQALEVIKEITGTGTGLVGRLLLYDARDTRFDTVRYHRRKQG